jgi:hypothetical protein
MGCGFTCTCRRRCHDTRRANGKPLTLFPTEPRIDKIVGYHFIHNCKWFTEDSGVMNLCKKYLDELEKFVVEYENKVRGVKS